MYTYQLTNYYKDNFAEKVAESINKDFPNKATTKPNGEGQSACFIDDLYWLGCLNYVKARCNTVARKIVKKKYMDRAMKVTIK
jgi:hypothetical protein